MEIKELFPYMAVINLRDRTDRREAFLAATDRYGFEIDVIHPPEPAQFSHLPLLQAKRMSLGEAEIEAVQRAQARGARGLLLFEDDAVFHEHMLLMLSQMVMPKDWHLFYFGCQHHETPDYISRGIVRCHRANDTHALGIRDVAYETVIATLRDPNRNVCNDKALTALQKTIPVYAAYPNLIWQSETYSDLMEKVRCAYFKTGEQKGWNSCPPPRLPANDRTSVTNFGYRFLSS